jgi:hypothetical protein
VLLGAIHSCGKCYWAYPDACNRVASDERELYVLAETLGDAEGTQVIQVETYPISPTLWRSAWSEMDAEYTQHSPRDVADSIGSWSRCCYGTCHQGRGGDRPRLIVHRHEQICVFLVQPFRVMESLSYRTSISYVGRRPSLAAAEPLWKGRFNELQRFTRVCPPHLQYLLLRKELL